MSMQILYNMHDIVGKKLMRFVQNCTYNVKKNIIKTVS